jgi:hypothetical protein
MKKNIKINFTDFWGGFDKTDNYFYNLLKEEFDVEISNNPDYLFYSVFGNDNLSYKKCIKIFFSGENIGPDFTNCDYSMCYDYLNDNRHYRLPLYILNGGYYYLVNKSVDDGLINRNFCNFIYSNESCRTRNNFFKKLSTYKKVDSGGRCLNNIGYLVGDKLEFQSKYKFSISFENEAYRPNRDGYTTEKIMQPMLANSIPIYWGNTLINKEFNHKSFINYHNFKSEDDLIDYIIYLDQNDEEYMKVMREPWLIDNKVLESLKEENIKKFLYNIFEK